MIAAWLALGLLGPAQEAVPATPSALGGGSYQQAEAEWEARRRWTREIDTLLAEPAPSTPDAQDAQETPPEPRTAQPAPLYRPAPSTALYGLLARLEGVRKSHAQALRIALDSRNRALAVSLAMRAESILRDDEDAVLMLLLELT